MLLMQPPTLSALNFLLSFFYFLGRGEGQTAKLIKPKQLQIISASLKM